MEAKIDEYVSEHKTTFKLLKEKHAINVDKIKIALKIVEDFIRARGLIVFGGQAIDYALRIKGSKLYPDEQIPDYDFLSKNHVTDAYDLVDILRSYGFLEARAIRAIHVQTFRVSILNTFVADCGQLLFDIPTFDYLGMKIASPNFQKIDIHSSLSLPYLSAPRDTILNRWGKDITRYNLMSEFYPIVHIPIQASKYTKTAEIKIKNYVVNGFLAYAIIRDIFEEIIGKSTIPKLTYKIGGDTITLESPTDDDIVINSTLELESLANSYKDFDIYDRCLEWIPFIFQTKNLQILMTKNKKIPFTMYKGIKICTIQYVLQWFLIHSLIDHPAIKRTPETKTIYNNYYKYTLDMMAEMEKHVLGNEKLIQLYYNLPFGLTVMVDDNDDNYDDSYILIMNSMITKFHINDTTISNMNLIANLHKFKPNFDQNLANITDNIPENYESSHAYRPELVDYSKNLIFRRNGAKLT